MVIQTPHHRPRVRTQPVSKPNNSEAFARMLAHPNNRSVTHVEVKLHVDLSNGNPDDKWMKSAIRSYEDAANAAIHSVLGLDVMTSRPAKPPLMINGTFLLYPRGVKKSVCFVYKLHIDDEYMPRLTEHLTKSNNSLTIKWTFADGNSTVNIKEFHARVSLPKTEGRNFILKGVPTHFDEKGIQDWLLLDHNIHVKNIRPKGRLEGMEDKENSNDINCQCNEWIAKVDYNVKPTKFDLGIYENEIGQYPISMFPQTSKLEQIIQPVQISYPIAPISYRNVLTNQQTPSPTRTVKIRHEQENVVNQIENGPSPQCKSITTATTPATVTKPKSRTHSPQKSTTVKRTPRSARKRFNETENFERKKPKSPKKLFTEPEEQDPHFTGQQEINIPPFGAILEPGPSDQNLMVLTRNPKSRESTMNKEAAQANIKMMEAQDMGREGTIAVPNATAQENRIEEDIAQPTARNQEEDQITVLNMETNEQMEQVTNDTFQTIQQGCPTSQ